MSSNEAGRRERVTAWFNLVAPAEKVARDRALADKWDVAECQAVDGARIVESLIRDVGDDRIFKIDPRHGRCPNDHAWSMVGLHPQGHRIKVTGHAPNVAAAMEAVMEKATQYLAPPAPVGWAPAQPPRAGYERYIELRESGTDWHFGSVTLSVSPAEDGGSHEGRVVIGASLPHAVADPFEGMRSTEALGWSVACELALALGADACPPWTLKESEAFRQLFAAALVPVEALTEQFTAKMVPGADGIPKFTEVTVGDAIAEAEEDLKEVFGDISAMVASVHTAMKVTGADPDKWLPGDWIRHLASKAKTFEDVARKNVETCRDAVIDAEEQRAKVRELEQSVRENAATWPQDAVVAIERNHERIRALEKELKATVDLVNEDSKDTISAMAETGAPEATTAPQWIRQLSSQTMDLREKLRAAYADRRELIFWKKRVVKFLEVYLDLGRMAAVKSVGELVEDICDRRGLKWAWAEIDDDVVGEIRADWYRIIERNFVAAVERATGRPPEPTIRRPSTTNGPRESAPPVDSQEGDGVEGPDPEQAEADSPGEPDAPSGAAPPEGASMPLPAPGPQDDKTFVYTAPRAAAIVDGLREAIGQKLSQVNPIWNDIQHWTRQVLGPQLAGLVRDVQATERPAADIVADIHRMMESMPKNYSGAPGPTLAAMVKAAALGVPVHWVENDGPEVELPPADRFCSVCLEPVDMHEEGAAPGRVFIRGGTFEPCAEVARVRADESDENDEERVIYVPGEEGVDSLVREVEDDGDPHDPWQE